MQPKKEAKRHGIHDDMHIREMFFWLFAPFNRNVSLLYTEVKFRCQRVTKKIKITIYASLTDDIFTLKNHDMFIRRRNFKANSNRIY